MRFIPQTVNPPAPAPAPAPAGAGTEPAALPTQDRERRAWLRAFELGPRHLALAAVIALSAVMNTYKLSQNGYANIFYSASVKSMLRSLHNFFFVSFDPGGLITVDKPPLALWVQVASAKAFGFSPLSLLLPEAIAGVLSVALLYKLVAKRLGPVAAIASALVLAIFPAFVAVSRENGVDPLLILLMLLACGAGLRACETGRWWTILWSGALVGLAFNTKTLAAYLVVPPIALGFLLCAPGSLSRRIAQLLAAGALMAAISFAWMLAVDATPASKRPYVGSSTSNSELGLTFEYNGFGRVGGQSGGPGQVPVRPGAVVPFTRRQLETIRHHEAQRKGSGAEFAGTSGSLLANARSKTPIPFGGAPSPVRLWGKGLGDQAGWLVPLGLFGLIAFAMVLYASWREPGSAQDDEPRRRDPRLALLVVLGGWFAVEALVLSFSKGIVHPYYSSALAPGTAAMAGVGSVAFARLLRGRMRWPALGLLGAMLLGTLAAQIVLLHREEYITWFIPVLLLVAGVGYCAAIAARRLAAPAIALLFCLFAIAPAAYSSTTWLAPVEGTFPAAGPKEAAGAGGVGVAGKHLQTYLNLIHYARATGTGSRWAIFTDAAPTAAPFILLGLDAGSLAGYSGTDPAIDGPGLARFVARGEARYVVLGGEFASRGGNRATAAVLRACRIVYPPLWNGPPVSPYGFVLFDCLGRERALTAAG